MPYGADVTTEGFAIGQEVGGTLGGAFDNVVNDANGTGSWYAYDGGYVTTGWTGQDFGVGNTKQIEQYKVMSVPHATRAWDPVDWTFEYSDDGAGWTVIDTVATQSFTQAEWKTYTFVHGTPHRYWRLNVSANNGDGTYLIIGEIEMMEAVATPLAVNDSTHAHPIDQPSVVLILAILTANDSTHAHSPDQPSLLAIYELTVADSTHAHTTDTFLLIVIIEPADSTHAHSADAITSVVFFPIGEVIISFTGQSPSIEWTGTSPDIGLTGQIPSIEWTGTVPEIEFLTQSPSIAFSFDA